MRIDGADIQKGVVGLPPEGKQPNSPEEAAKHFEKVLIKQMLSTMTKELFDSNLTGDDAPGWMGAYSEMQGDVLTEELARQLSANGRMGIADMLMKQWKRQGDLPTDAANDVDGAPPEGFGTPALPNNVNARSREAVLKGSGPVNPYTEV